MFEEKIRLLKFWAIMTRLFWMKITFEGRTDHKPTHLFLRDDVFDFVYHSILMYGFFGSKNPYHILEIVYLGRDNGIKFARYE